MPACECGLDYVHGNAGDEEFHRVIHSEYENGPRLDHLEHVPVIDVVQGYPLVVATRSTPPKIRAGLAYIALVAHREMSEFPSGYDGSITEADERIYVLRHEERGVAFVLGSMDGPYWRLRWTGDGVLTVDQHALVAGDRVKVGRVWVARGYRRKGLACAMVEAFAKHYSTEVRDLGWELPLTGDGRALLNAISPDGLLGRGDRFALEETVRP